VFDSEKITGRPLSLDELTEELDREILKGMKDHKNGDVFSADEIEAEMENRINKA
jgi:hypothetical protein